MLDAKKIDTFKKTSRVLRLLQTSSVSTPQTDRQVQTQINRLTEKLNTDRLIDMRHRQAYRQT